MKKAAHKPKEQNQVKTYRMNKTAATKENCQDIQNSNISKSTGKWKSIKKASTFITAISMSEVICSCKDGKRSSVNSQGSTISLKKV